MNGFLFDEQIDVDENNILRENPNLLNLLLKDRTTKKNIIWATKSYEPLGKGFEADSNIRVDLITGNRVSLIRPRVEKAKYEQKERTKGKAEVYTPTWIVKKQNDIVDEDFKHLPLEEYISKVWLEIACGEAPYMVSRYDTVTGVPIQVKDRIGFVDRKLERISEEINVEQEWFKYVCQAYQTCYGYEFQGDSLLLARENLLYTFIDYYEVKFGKSPSIEQQKEIAKIISYNIFQMDGLKYTVPYTEKVMESEKIIQLDLFGEPEELEEIELDLILPGIPVKIKVWKSNQMIEFQSLTRRNLIMRFDVVIGNPPYQDETQGNNRDTPIYNFFMDESYKIADKVELITPARFLFDAGQTPSVWNKKMLDDPHLKVELFEQKSALIFPNTDIKGGVAITYRDATKDFGSIGIFISDESLKSITKKVNSISLQSINEIHHNRSSYRLTEQVFKENPQLKGRVNKSEEKSIGSNIFDKFPEIFSDQGSINSDYVRMFGRQNNSRVFKWVKKNYIAEHPTLYKWKVFVAKSNGTGAFGEALSPPEIIEPGVVTTQTFISFGPFDSKFEAEAFFKYLKSKLLRTLLSVKKGTPDNARKQVWEFVPLQDFTPASDIDWTKSIPEIDQQLYKKYGLNEEEINFIETKVKEMD